jgi:hypothetical protein
VDEAHAVLRRGVRINWEASRAHETLNPDNSDALAALPASFQAQLDAVRDAAAGAAERVNPLKPQSRPRSRYSGVRFGYFSRRRQRPVWAVQLHLAKKATYCGSFGCEVTAAAAYDALVEALRGVEGPNGAACARVAAARAGLKLPDVAVRLLEANRLGGGGAASAGAHTSDDADCALPESQESVAAAWGAEPAACAWAADAQGGPLAAAGAGTPDAACGAALAAADGAFGVESFDADPLDECAGQVWDEDDAAFFDAMGWAAAPSAGSSCPASASAAAAAAPDAAAAPVSAASAAVAAAEKDASAARSLAALHRTHRTLRLRQRRAAGERWEALRVEAEAVWDTAAAARVGLEEARRRLDSTLRGRSSDRLLHVLSSDPAFLPAQASEAAQRKLEREALADMLSDFCFAFTAGRTDVAQRQTVLERQRATGVNEALLDLPAPRPGQCGAAFGGQRRGAPQCLLWEYKERDGVVARTLAPGDFALPSPHSLEVQTTRPGVRRVWFAPPPGALNGCGEPAWVPSVSEQQRGEVAPHLAARMEARSGSAHARAYKSRGLGDVPLPQPLGIEDCSREGLTAWMEALASSMKEVAAGGQQPATLRTHISRLHTFEAVLRMYGLSLMNFTDRGVPEQVRAARARSGCVAVSARAAAARRLARRGRASRLRR